MWCLQVCCHHKTCWRCRGLNPGPHTCKACALPLSYIPPFTVRIKIADIWEEIEQRAVAQLKLDIYFSVKGIHYNYSSYMCRPWNHNVGYTTNDPKVQNPKNSVCNHVKLRRAANLHSDKVKPANVWQFSLLITWAMNPLQKREFSVKFPFTTNVLKSVVRVSEERICLYEWFLHEAHCLKRVVFSPSVMWYKFKSLWYVAQQASEAL